MKDTAILVVSFGSTHLDTLERCIASTEKTIGDNFPGYPVYRAFLSPTVIRRLKEKHQLHADTVAEALAAILHDGCRQVIVQPTLLLGGFEYELLMRQLGTENNLQIHMGRPLIVNREDCRAVASVIMEENPLKEKEALLLMGHGTEHEANGVYEMLQDVFDHEGYRCLIGTVESKPSFEDAVTRLTQSGASQAKLLPLMFVAGDHAKNDMAGEKDSLLAMVREAGIHGIPMIQGLGESKGIQELYVERVREAFREEQE